MLVLARRLQETIVIGGEIYVTVTHISPEQVWLGISADRRITVDRLEVHERKQRESRGASE